MSKAAEIKNIEEKVLEKMPAMGEAIVTKAIDALDINTESPTEDNLRKLIDKVIELASEVFDKDRVNELEGILRKAIYITRVDTVDAFFGI